MTVILTLPNQVSSLPFGEIGTYLLYAILCVLLFGNLYLLTSCKKNKALTQHIHKRMNDLERSAEHLNELTNKSSDILRLGKERSEFVTKLHKLRESDQLNIDKKLSEIHLKLGIIAGNIKNSDIVDAPVFDDVQSRIAAKHPDLTEGEIELAQMIISGMDNKTIGEMKSISINSVRTNKSRLKRKLGLEKDQGLSDYLKEVSR